MKSQLRGPLVALWSVIGLSALVWQLSYLLYVGSSILLTLALMGISLVMLVGALIFVLKKRFLGALLLLLSGATPYVMGYLQPSDLEVRGAKALVHRLGAEALAAEGRQMCADYHGQLNKDGNKRLSDKDLELLKDRYPALAALGAVYIEVHENYIEAKEYGMGTWTGYHIWLSGQATYHSPNGVIRIAEDIYWYDPENQRLASEY